MILLPPEPSPPGKAGHLGRKFLRQPGLDRPGDFNSHPGRKGGPAVGSHLFSPRPCPHNHFGGLHCIPAGQPPLGSERGGPCTPRPPFSHHLTLQQPPSCHGIRQAPPPGGNDLPVHGLSPQRAPAQHGDSERSGPRRGRTLCSQRELLWLPRERRLHFKKWWD